MKIPELLVRLDDIPTEGRELVLNIAPDRLSAILSGEGETPPKLLSPLTGTLTLTRRDQRLTVKGEFQAGAEISCDRCLADIATTLRGRLDETLELTTEPGLGSNGNDDEDGPESLAVENGQVDLSGLVSEYFWLTWPFRFICRPDCAGLCSRCGADLNLGPCGCQN